METATSVAEMSRMNFQSIPVDKIKSSSHQARKQFNEASIQALSESMREEGLLQPITVRRLRSAAPSTGENVGVPSAPTGQAESDTYYFELIAGERRLRAAKLLGWPRIDAKVIQPISEGEAAAKGLIENLQREDLNPIEEAEGIQAILDLHDDHWTQEEIGKVLGKSQSDVSKTLRLLALSEEIKENIRRRIFSADHAAELLRLPTPELQSQVADQVQAQDLSRNKTRAVVGKLLKVKKATAKKTGRPSYDAAYANFWPSLMANSKIKACGYWDVKYKKDKWSFTVGAETIGAKEDFATWFRQMAEAIEKIA